MFAQVPLVAGQKAMNKPLARIRELADLNAVWIVGDAEIALEEGDHHQHAEIRFGVVEICGVTAESIELPLGLATDDRGP